MALPAINISIRSLQGLYKVSEPGEENKKNAIILCSCLNPDFIKCNINHKAAYACTYKILFVLFEIASGVNGIGTDTLANKGMMIVDVLKMK